MMEYMMHSLQWYVCVCVFCIQNVIDGDLCEMFNALDAGKQKSVAEELDRTPSEVRPLLIYVEIE